MHSLGGSMYDWNDLRVFLAIARSGSALSAARDLGLNQTTVTRRIDALEHALGASLFVRGARGSDLTEQGQAMMPHAEAVERAALTLNGEADRLRRDHGGEIRITAPEAIMATIVGPLTQHYRRLHPDVRFDYLSAEQRLDLAKGEADVAFRAGGVLEGDTLIGVALPDIFWTAYCSKGYAARHPLPKGLDDMAGHKVIGFAGPIAGMPHLRAFLAAVPDADRVGNSNNVPNMTGLVRAGLGIGLLPCFVGDMQPDLLRCYDPPDGMMTPWWIVVAPEAWVLPRVRNFVGEAADILRRLRPALCGEVDQAQARAMLLDLARLDG